MSHDPGAQPDVPPAQPERPLRAEPPEAIEPIADVLADIPAERALLARAIGGWRGMIDSSLPAAVFLVAYLVTGNDLTRSIWAAIVVGVLMAVLRLVRRESLQQVAAGFAGVAVSAFVASRTGQASDYYLPGLLINVVYGVALLASILVGWPLIGVVVGLLTGEGTSWRSAPEVRRAYAAATWVWVGVFGLRLVVQVPLYLAQSVGPLGVARIAMGWPLYLLGAYVTYRLLRPVLAKHRESQPSSTEPPRA